MLVGLLAVAFLVLARVDRLASLPVGGRPLRVVFEAVWPRVFAAADLQGWRFLAC